MKNVMVDLETLGNNSESVIISIGAVEFDETGVGAVFYTTVDPQSCMDVGLKMDASTVMWWLRQSDAARRAFSGETYQPLTLPGALTRFSEFFAACGAEFVWGNGATFDNVILANAYAKVGLPRPWPYWGDRCYRTLKNLYPEVKMTNHGVAHNAKDDAIAQALHASAILGRIMEMTSREAA